MSRKKKLPSEHNAVYRAVDRWFCMSERGTNIKTELYAGLLMFLEVVCMAAVSAQLIASNGYISSYTTVYYGIMLVSTIGTVLMGLICNAPLIQSLSMAGVTLIVSMLSGYMGLTLANVMMIALISNGIYLLVMLIPPLRCFFANAVPQQVKKALPAAMGAYLLVYALSQLGVFGIEGHNFNDVLQKMAAAGDALPWWGLNTTTLTLANISSLGWYVTNAVITGVIAFVLLAVFQARKRKHAVALSFLFSALAYVALWVIRGSFMDYYFYAFMTPAYGGMYFYDSVPRISSEFNASMLFKSVTDGFDFTRYVNYQKYLESKATGVSMKDITLNVTPQLILICISSVLSFLALGVSETAAGVSASAFASESYDKNGKITYRENRHLRGFGKLFNVYAVNALSAVIGCVMGAGPVMVRGESAVGGKEGGKTGLAAIFAAILCGVSLYTVAFSGIFMNGAILFGILIFVALTLLMSFRNCDFTSAANAMPFLVTVGAAALTQNIGTAILCGIVLDTLTKLLSGKAKEVHPGSYVYALLAIAMVVLPQFI